MTTIIENNIRNKIESELDAQIESWDEDKNILFMDDGTEYLFFLSESDAESCAIDQVTAMLEDEPESFNQDWLQSFISMSDTDRRCLAADESDSYISDMTDEEILDYLGIEYTEDETAIDQSYNMSKLRDEALEQKYDELYDAYADPIQYFVHDQGIYTREELIHQSFVSIDFDEAASDAVSVDGIAHFLASYDGQEIQIGEFRLYRTN